MKSLIKLAVLLGISQTLILRADDLAPQVLAKSPKGDSQILAGFVKKDGDLVFDTLKFKGALSGEVNIDGRIVAKLKGVPSKGLEWNVLWNANSTAVAICASFHKVSELDLLMVQPTGAKPHSEFAKFDLKKEFVRHMRAQSAAWKYKEGDFRNATLSLESLVEGTAVLRFFVEGGSDAAHQLVPDFHGELRLVFSPEYKVTFREIDSDSP